jgi:hypothetical protein
VGDKKAILQLGLLIAGGAAGGSAGGKGAGWLSRLLARIKTRVRTAVKAAGRTARAAAEVVTEATVGFKEAVKRGKEKVRDALAKLRRKRPGDSVQTEVGSPPIRLSGGGHWLDKNGNLTNGRYTVSSTKMDKHKTGSLVDENSQFLSHVDAETSVLDAAELADKFGLWDANGKAKVYTDTFVGVHGTTGLRTNVLNVYRDKRGRIHGAPGTPE